MAIYKTARQRRAPEIDLSDHEPAMTLPYQRTVPVVHVVPGWAAALCGARPGAQPANAVPNCRRCLSLLTGE